MANKNFVSNKDESVRIFKNPLLDKISYVSWYMPLIVWLPIVSYMLYRAIFVLGGDPLLMAGLFVAALFAWTITEYILHRFVFHFEPKSKLGKRLHFVMHGVHHDYPNDSKRLVMPPALSILIALPFVFLFQLLLGNGTYFYMAFAGFVMGYLIYDMMHYALHYVNFQNAFWQKLKHHHMLHHYNEPEKGFGVSSMFWDGIFGTTLTAFRKDKNKKSAQQKPQAAVQEES